MTKLRESMIADMTAAGLSASTKEVYVPSVRNPSQTPYQSAPAIGS